MTNSLQPQPTPLDPDKRNNDRWWVAGGFYVNRNDPRLFLALYLLLCIGYLRIRASRQP